MAWTQNDLDAISSAIAGNKKSVTFADGRQVTYQDVDKMLSVRNAIKAELNAALIPGGRTRSVVGRVCRR